MYSDFDTEVKDRRQLTYALELYLDYRSLKVAHLVELLECLETTYRIVYGISQDLGAENNTDEYSMSDFFQQVEELLQENPKDRLQIASISTEESIKFKAKTGWAPSVYVEDSEVVIELPKGVLALVVSATLLGGAVSTGVGVVKDFADTVQTIEEIDRGRREDERKAREEAERLLHKAVESPPHVQNDLNDRLDKFLDLTVRHEDISKAEVNLEIPDNGS